MDTVPILKRPKPTDNEEELFRMQEEFLKNKQQPSAKVINLRNSKQLPSSIASVERQSGTNRVKSKFSELKRLKTQDRVSTSQISGDVLNPIVTEEVQKDQSTGIQDSVHNLPIAPSNIILGNIVEKKYNPQKLKFKPDGKVSSNTFITGFPEVFVSDEMKNDSNQSLFWKQICEREHISKSTGNQQDSGTSGTNADISVIVEGPWAKEIHEENLERLSQMTQEDILQERNKLEMNLKPEIIQFLKNRKNKKQKVKNDQGDSNKSESSSSIEIKMEVDEKEVDNTQNKYSCDDNDIKLTKEYDSTDKLQEIIPKPPVELMEQAKEKGWLHMDSLEPEKLKWMEDLNVEKKDDLVPDKPYIARFDFNGLLLPYKDGSILLQKGLHHHGEEPERPGYSLQELLQLSRSSTKQQRCTALMTLANIIEKSRKGWYDKVLEPAPLTTLSQRNLLLLLRFSLDESSVSIVSVSLQALRAFLYSETDEICLDRLYGYNYYKEPTLTPSKGDISDISNLKDHELAQLDAVAALLRTDIILRIRYILNEIRPPPVAVTCALEILIRLARHSNITALNIASTPYLLEMIIEHFIPLSTDLLVMQDSINNVYGVPVIAAVRFCRILISYGGKPVAERLDRLKVIQSIISYISCDTGKGNANLTIESLRLWKTMLLHGVAIDSIEGAQLIMVSQLRLLLSNHDLQTASELSCEYAANLISIASSLPALRSNISVLLSKWSVQLLSLSTPTWGTTKLIAETLLAIDDNSTIMKLTVSRSQVFSKLRSTSNLLSSYTPAKNREPSCLPSLGVVTEDGQLQPIVSHKSCIPFLATVLNVFVRNSFITEIEAVLNLPEVHTYLKKLGAEDWCFERSWYTRSELMFLVGLVNAAFIVKNRVNSEMAYIIWKVAIKLVSSLPADLSSNVKDMLRIVLSEERLHLEMVMNELSKLNLNASMNEIKMHLNRNVAALYEQYITSIDEWEEATMPKDWLYLPLVHIYTKCKNNGKFNDADKSSILTLLSLELILPDLVKELSECLRFSRLVLIYLCDTLYLNNDVSALLCTAISILLKNHYKSFNFTLSLSGLNSFTDLFTALCEQFSSSSYGDYGFAMTLLVPIAQRHDVHYRKLLWSEHAGVLRYLRLPLEKLVIPLKEYFYPVEEDTSLIESYITALVRGIVKQTWCPIPYAIAVHHSAMYLKKSSKLAARMRMHIEKLPDKELSAILLHYEPLE